MASRQADEMIDDATDRLIQRGYYRKPIQIAVAAETGENAELFALCDDGSIWMLGCPSIYRTPQQWERMPPIPRARRMCDEAVTDLEDDQQPVETQE